ncbi:transglutaminase-like domain-containing protein [Bernardetia sp. ABR2-2B]|uniref:transglutaminase-like domain-containing protein n=1 Tax=Bernardetia sp. ABR2-2B TaxID=3127472 RepID=UPI0030CCE0E8
MIAQSKRQLKSGKRYDHLIPKPNFQNTKLSDLIEVGFTVKSMKNIVRATHTDVARLAQALKGKTITETCSTIFHFVYDHIQYEKDRRGIEEIRTPARMWADKKGDCDCFSVFIGALLYSLKIPFAFRITKYSSDWQHVYIIVYNDDAPNRKELKLFKDEITGEEYEKVVRTNKPKRYNIIDPVTDDDDYEVEFTDKQDHKMSTLLLSGIDDYDTDYQDDDYGNTTVEEDLGALGLFKRRKRKKRKSRNKKKRKGGAFSRFKNKRKARKAKRNAKRAAKRTAKKAKKRLSSRSLDELVKLYTTNRGVLNDKTWQSIFKQFLARAKREASYKAALQRVSTSAQTRNTWNAIIRHSVFKKAYTDYQKNPSSSKSKGRKRGFFNRFRKKNKGTSTRKKKKRRGIFSRFRKKNKGGSTKKRGGIFSKLRTKLKERKKKRKARRKTKRADRAKKGKTNFLKRWKQRRKQRRDLKRRKNNAKKDTKRNVTIRTRGTTSNQRGKGKVQITKDKINPIKIDHQNDIQTDDFNFDDFDAGTTSTTTTKNTGSGGKSWTDEDGDFFSEGDWGGDDTPETQTQKSGGSEQKEDDIFFDTSEIEKGIDDDLDFDMQQSSKDIEAATKNLTENLPMLKDDFAAMVEDDGGLLDDEGDFADAKFDELDEFGDEEPQELNLFQKGIAWAKENPKTAVGIGIGGTVIIGGTVYLLTRPKKPTSYQPYKPKSSYKPRSAGKKGKSLKGTAAFAGFS